MWFRKDIGKLKSVVRTVYLQEKSVLSNTHVIQQTTHCHQSNPDSIFLEGKFEDSRSRKSNERQCKKQKTKNRKRTNNDVQDTTYKNKIDQHETH